MFDNLATRNKIVSVRKQSRSSDLEPVSDTAVFVRVVDEGSFTAAATTLELSKGAVSKYVRRLEARLGARLLNRTTRRLSLTEVGESFYKRATLALNELAEAELEVVEHTGKPRGHLRVSAPSFYGAEILARHLGTFRRLYPDISLELILENRIVNLVEERFDAAIRMSAPRDSSLVMRKLADIPIVVSAAPAYLERSGRPDVPDDLIEHECLIYMLAPPAHEWAFVNERGERFTVPVRGSLRTNDDHALRLAALDGQGILRMPRLFVQESIARGELVQLWPDATCPTVTLAIVYPSRHELPGKVRAFVDFVGDIPGQQRNTRRSS